MKKRRLYVVGENSPKPSEWSTYPLRALVIASDEREALELIGEAVPPGEVLEVSMDDSALLEYSIMASSL
jgi:hypothetical protein